MMFKGAQGKVSGLGGGGQSSQGAVTVLDPSLASTYAGEYFSAILSKVQRIVAFQFKNRTSHGIKGFVFHGQPGSGKTTMAKVLACNLSLRLLFVDGAVVARSQYGASEQQIASIFKEASSAPSLILIDDADCLFPDRDYEKSEAWHASQNNVLFHELDKMDSSRDVVVLTTNKPERLDKALMDRLYSIGFPELDAGALVEIAELRCKERDIPSHNVVKKIMQEPELVRSIRDVEKMVTEEYIDSIVREGSGAVPPLPTRTPAHFGLVSLSETMEAAYSDWKKTIDGEAHRD